MDFAGHVLHDSHSLYARSSTSSDSRPAVYKVVGIILAISSGLFIGVSFVLKKKGLLRANLKYNEEAGEGYGYLRNWMWWTGMTLMIIGEVCNFVAYAFVDAILVTPMGALSVVVTAILSAIFLKERLSFVGKIGCFNCIVGSVVIVINAPEQSAVAKIQDMQKLVIAPGFLSYAGVVIIGCAFIAFWAGPRYGKKTMMVYISICSLIGGLSVVATQGLGAAIVAQIGGTPQFNQWFLYVLFVFVVATLLTEIIYLNKALNLFNAALVTPTYYVFFTSSTIVTSAILFQGFKGTASTISTVVMGFLQICSGVVLLQLSKSAKDVPDTAVFTGDLDQVRTVAEQEEPEYEPRADTLRGSAAILRTFSMARQRREAEEVRTLHSSQMDPIGENESVEWDGLRRRKTVLEPGQHPIQRRKTVHPPLGMSYFPGSDDETDRGSDEDVHPGFFSRLSTRRKRLNKQQQGHTSSHPVPLETMDIHTKSGTTSSQSAPPLPSQVIAHDYASNNSSAPHIYGLPPGLRLDGGGDDTTYRSPGPSGGHLQWDPTVEERAKSSGSIASSSLAPPAPRPPPHTSGSGSKRQFSFQNVFARVTRPDSSASPSVLSPSLRPTSARSGLSFHGRKPSQTGPSKTEEERLGLVKGDSQNLLGSELRETDEYSSPPSYSDNEPAVELSDEDGWAVPRQPGGGARGAGSSHGHERALTGAGLGAAPVDVRVPAPGVPTGRASPGLGSSSAGGRAYARARRTSDSDDSYDEAVAGGKKM